MKRSVIAATVIAAAVVSRASCKKNKDVPHNANADDFWKATQAEVDAFLGSIQ